MLVPLQQHTLCLLLQAVALIAQDIKNHALLLELHADELLMQVLLPADSWYVYAGFCASTMLIGIGTIPLKRRASPNLSNITQRVHLSTLDSVRT